MPIASNCAAPRAHRLEQVGGAVELAGRPGGVAGGHEQLAHARREQAVEHLVEVGAVAHEPRREVRHHEVAGARVRRSVSSSVASRPLLGDAVTVIFTSVARWARTSSSMPSSGSTSKRALRSRSARAPGLLATRDAATLIYQATRVSR